MYNQTDVFLIFFTTFGPLKEFCFLFPLCLEEGWLTFLIDTKFFFTFGFSFFSWLLFDTAFDLVDDNVELVLSVLGLKQDRLLILNLFFQ